MPRVTILYEDAPAPGTRPADYGPHQLLLWCLADRTGKRLWELGKLVEGNARKGKEQVRATCRSRQVFGRAVVIAVYDNDRVRDLPGITELPSKRSRDVAEVLRKEAAQPERTAVLLLERNMDWVVAKLLECAGKDLEGNHDPSTATGC